MRKINKILAVAFAALTLVACDDIVAKPTVVIDENVLVDINFNDKDHDWYDDYNNDFGVIYDKMVDAGTSNSVIMDAITRTFAVKEVSRFYGLTTEEFEAVLDDAKATLNNKGSNSLTENQNKLKTIIVKYLKKALVSKVKSGSYTKDNKYFEEKLVNELRNSLYNIPAQEKYIGDDKDVYILPGDYETMFANLLSADYSDYIEKNIYPTLLKELLTSVYLYENSYTSIGRAYAREVSYIKIDTISTHKESTPLLIDAFFKNYVNGTAKFDLNQLAKLYKGVDLTTEEQKFLTDNGIFTKHDIITEELAKVGVLNGDEYNILPENDPNRDATLISSYTGNYSYPVSHGKQLKEDELKTLDIVVDEDDLVIKNGGVSNLPSDMRNRLFSSSVNNYTTEIANANGEKVKILLPKKTPTDPNASFTSKYAYYADNAYYIVLVGDSYNISSLSDKDATKDVAMEISRILAKTTNKQKDALLHYLEQYEYEFGDQDFYDYIEEIYPDILEDEDK